MSGLTFASDAARRLEALYMSADVVAQRSDTLRKLRLAKGNSVLDVGSGPGFLCESMADIVGPSGRVLGIDISDEFVGRATGRNDRAWLSYRICDATAVDEPDASFDVVTCTQVAEYIPDVDKAISETYRVLKPGGQALFVATDWDGVIWYSDVPARMAAVMKAWEPHCAHPRLPRTMARRLRSGGFQLDSATVFPILNLRWDDDAYSKGSAGIIADFVAKRGSIDKGDIAAWIEEMPRLSEEGRYFFSSGRFVFSVSKPW